MPGRALLYVEPARLIRTLRAAALLSLFALPALAQSVPALQVIAPDGSTSLLLGTMHLGDPRIIQPSVAAVLTGARRLVIEAQPDPNAPSKGIMDKLDPAAFDTLVRTGKIRRAGWVTQMSPDDLALLRAHVACYVSAEQVDSTMDALLAMKAWVATYTVALPCPPARERLARHDDHPRCPAARHSDRHARVSG